MADSFICPKCGTMLVPAKTGKGMRCARCKYKTREKIEIIEKTEITKEKKKGRMQKEIETMPAADVECEKCGNKEAYWWVAQTQDSSPDSDPLETRFFRCTKCSHTWREYA